jgi:hypothetical protein
MTRTGFAILIGAVYAASAFAQSAPSSVSLASGTLLNAELNSTADSKKAKAGDKLEAHTTVDSRNDGRMVIPKGTKLVGHITQASARAKGDSESVLAIQFDKAILKNGQEIQLTAEIRAIAAPQRDFSAGSDSPGSDPLANRGAAAAGGSPMGPSRPVNPPPGTTAPADSPSPGVAPEGPAVRGPLAANSRGVYGLSGLQLAADKSNANAGTTITSTGKNVHLDGGTRLLLISQAETPASGTK